MAAAPENQKEQDKPQQTRQQLAREKRARLRHTIGQLGKQPIPGEYDDELESEEGAATNIPARPDDPDSH